jgi:hypothetical protein
MTESAAGLNTLIEGEFTAVPLGSMSLRVLLMSRDEPPMDRTVRFRRQE